MSFYYNLAIYAAFVLAIALPIAFMIYRERSILRKQRQKNALSLLEFRQMIAASLASKGIAIEGGASAVLGSGNSDNKNTLSHQHRYQMEVSSAACLEYTF